MERQIACRVLGMVVLGLATTGSPTGAQEKHSGPSKEAMHAMPFLQEKGTTVVKGDEDWAAITGFGKDSGMAEMMTLMMVGGSGMEHMKMGSMRMDSKGIAAMGMGDRGMDRRKKGAMASDNGKLGGTVVVNTPGDAFKVGKNLLDVTILDASGKPVEGARMMATVAMTNMDMGTTHPKAIEGKNGHYTTQVEFSMQGPWRVNLTVTAPKMKPFVRTLAFDVKE
jgi:hypothetical protein